MPATIVSPVTRRPTVEERRQHAVVVPELDGHREVVVGARIVVRRVDQVRDQPRALLELDEHDDARVVGRFGWSDKIHVRIRPRPLASCVSHSSDPQLPHIGAGG